MQLTQAITTQGASKNAGARGAIRALCALVAITNMLALPSARAQSEVAPAEERVCNPRGGGAGKTPSTAEAFAHCKRGDVISVGWLLPRGAAHVCDFSKEMIRSQLNEVQFCVYIGRPRAEAT